MNVVIIEDEPLMATELSRLISVQSPTWSIQQKLGSIREALTYFETAPLPDLFFSDIQLTDGLSFEIFKQLECVTPVIFCTAFDHYALDAFRANGIDYILKPFDEEAINKTISKYQSLQKPQHDTQVNIRALLNAMEKTTARNISTLLVHQGENMIPLDVKSIALVALQSDLVYVHTLDHRSYMINKSMDSLEKILGNDFFRANRQCLVNKVSIHSVSPYFARKLIIKPKIPFDEIIVVSKAKSSRFLRWLEGL
ncbi:MAG: LytR/AlgR family response regulator transcription factor [Bacteroidia bacterium]